MGRGRARKGLPAFFFGLAFLGGTAFVLLGLFFFAEPLAVLFGVDDFALLFDVLFGVTFALLGVVAAFLLGVLVFAGVALFFFGEEDGTLSSSSTKSICSFLLVPLSSLPRVAFLFFAESPLNLVGLVGLRSLFVRKTGAVFGAFLVFNGTTGANGWI